MRLIWQCFVSHSYLKLLDFENNNIRYIGNTSKKNCIFYNALTELILSTNMLTTVDMELFNVFVSLRQVDLQRNRITTLSGRLVHRSLEILAMNKNKLGHVDLCGWDVPSMKKVSFASNNLTTLPQCITNWTSVSKSGFRLLSTICGLNVSNEAHEKSAICILRLLVMTN